MIDLVILSFALILARTAAFVAALPILSGATIPSTVKAGLAVALAGFYFSMLGPEAARGLMSPGGEASWLVCGLALAKEALLGAFLGFALGLVLLPASIAGDYLSQEMGLSLAQLADPTAPNPSEVVNQIFTMIASVLFLGMDGHHVFFGALDSVFQHIPLGRMPTSLPTGGMVTALARAQEWGLVLAAPLGAALFLTSITLALLSRAAPQLNVFALGLGLRLAVGLGGALLLLPDFLGALVRVLDQMSRLLEGLV